MSCSAVGLFVVYHSVYYTRHCNLVRLIKLQNKMQKLDKVIGHPCVCTAVTVIAAINRHKASNIEHSLLMSLVPEHTDSTVPAS